MFSMQSVSYIPLVETLQLSSVASLNLGRSQNGVLGNGLTSTPQYSLSEPLATFPYNHCRNNGQR